MIVCVLWHINIFCLFKAKTIYIQIILNNSVEHEYTFSLLKIFLFQAIQFIQTFQVKTFQFTISAAAMSKTLLFQVIKFSISTQLSST